MPKPQHCRLQAACGCCHGSKQLFNVKPQRFNVCFCNWHAHAQTFNCAEFTHGSILMYTNVFAAWYGNTHVGAVGSATVTAKANTGVRGAKLHARRQWVCGHARVYGSMCWEVQQLCLPPLQFCMLHLCLVAEGIMLHCLKQSPSLV